MIYAVVFEKAPHNWAAYSRTFRDVSTTGPTLEDTRRLIADAIEFHIEGMRLHGEPVPEPSTVVDSVEVRAAGGSTRTRAVRSRCGSRRPPVSATIVGTHASRCRNNQI